LLRRADARGSADTIYCKWRIALPCGPGIVNDVTHSVGHAQNILTLRRNLISLAIFNTIFWKTGGGYFFGATSYSGQHESQ